MPLTQHIARLFIAPLAFLLLGVSWSIASPVGSGADEQFQATSIWCAWGESETCAISADELTVSVPGAISKSFCYIKWPAVAGAGCLTDFIENSPLNDTLTATNYFSLDSTYSPAYFKIARTFVGNDVETSVLAIRIFNVIIAALLLVGAFLIGSKSIRRALMLSWGLVIIPVGIFFIASINPSAWMIAGIGTYWAFLATALSNNAPKWNRAYAWVGSAISAGIALGARTDAVIYLSILTLALVALNARNIKDHLSRTAGVALLILFGGIISFGGWIFLNRFQEFLASQPFRWGSDIPVGNLPAPLRTVVELPSFFFGIFGGQGPFTDVQTSLNYSEGDRTSGFVYGLGWMEFDVPSFVGIFGASAALAVLFVSLRNLTPNRVSALFILVGLFVAFILLVRASVDFTNLINLQPRYLLPLILGSIGVALILELTNAPLLSRSQTTLLVVALTISGSVAWLATASRYAIGPEGLLTNFGQPYEWWREIGTGRLGWFIIAAMATALWVYATVGIWGRSSLQSRENNEDPKLRLQLPDD